MSSPRHVHYSHRFRLPAHPISFFERLLISIFIPFLLILISIVAVENLGYFHIPGQASFDLLIKALFVSFGRIFAAYIFALVLGIFLGLLAVRNNILQRILLPVYDVLESVPVLVFFPVIILFFIHNNYLNIASITVIFLSMIWNIVFNIIGGIRLIPLNILEVADVFGYKGMNKFFTVILPALIPSIITGSLLAWGQGWNILIVAEVLHTYVPSGTNVNDLFGIGSVLVHASSNSNQSLFIGAVVVIVVAIALLNFFVWQGLLRYSEKFKFD